MGEKINSLSGLGQLLSQEIAPVEVVKAVEAPSEALSTPKDAVTEKAESYTVVPEVIENKISDDKVIDQKANEKQPEVKAEEKKEEPVLSKSFEQLLEERTSGKYKSWDDVEKQVNQNPFADETISKINEYVKQGGKLEDWVSTQSINIEELTGAEKIAMQMSITDPEMSEAEIELEMKLKYGFDKWKDNVDEYEDGVEPDDVKIMKLRFERESQKAEKLIKEYQKKWSVPQVNIEDQRQQQDLLVKKWNDNVDESIKSVSKIPIKVSDKQSFDYVISSDEIKEANQLVKQMFTDSNAMFANYVDPKKPMGVNVEGLTEMIVRAKNFDKIMAFAVDQALSVGKEKVVKDIKNITFASDGKQQAPVAQTLDQALVESIKLNRPFA